MQSVYLALGSNLGDREKYLRAAVTALSACNIHVVRCAPVYCTEPHEFVDQPWFLNTVVEARTHLEPDQLLRVCLEIETANDRDRAAPNGPRTLDIDVIFYGNRIIRKPGLTIPHPKFADRRFVLQPLAEIAPEWIDPISGKPVRELLQACKDQSSVFLHARSLE